MCMQNLCSKLLVFPLILLDVLHSYKTEHLNLVIWPKLQRDCSSVVERPTGVCVEGHIGSTAGSTHVGRARDSFPELLESLTE